MAFSTSTHDQRSSLEQKISLEQRLSQDQHASLEDETVPADKILAVQTRAQGLLDHREDLITPKQARSSPKHLNAAGPSRHSTIPNLPQGSDPTAHTYPPPSADDAVVSTAALNNSQMTDPSNELQKPSLLFKLIFAMCPTRKQTESLA
ncbi:unnamed protein product [Peniophora sp. CBMAI 1063]|nr:unnamed protein product [Peniophora sp. CBMAI 1063]